MLGQKEAVKAILEKAKEKTVANKPNLSEDAINSAVSGIMDSVHKKDSASLRKALSDFISVTQISSADERA